MTTSAVSRLFLRFLKNLRSTAELRRHRDRRRLASQSLVVDPEEVEAEFIARGKISSNLTEIRSPLALSHCLGRERLRVGSIPTATPVAETDRRTYRHEHTSPTQELRGRAPADTVVR